MNPNKDTRKAGDWYEPTRQWSLRFIKDTLAFEDAGCLLELGVNTGVISEQIAADEKYGIDIDTKLVAAARKKGIKAIVHDLNYPLPYKPAMFDTVIAVETFEHVADYYGLLAECSRVLKVGGRLIIIVPYHGLVKNIASAIVEPRHFMDRQHVHFYTPKYLIRDCEEQGFTLLRYAEFGRIHGLSRVFGISLVKDKKFYRGLYP